MRPFVDTNILVSTLDEEDLQHGQVFEGRLRVENPFR